VDYFKNKRGEKWWGLGDQSRGNFGGWG